MSRVNNIILIINEQGSQNQDSTQNREGKVKS